MALFLEPGCFPAGVLGVFLSLLLSLIQLLGKEVLLLMQALNTLSTPEEKLAALCKKYADLVSSLELAMGEAECGMGELLVQDSWEALVIPQCGQGGKQLRLMTAASAKLACSLFTAAWLPAPREENRLGERPQC